MSQNPLLYNFQSEDAFWNMNRPSWRSSVLIYYKVYKFIKYITVIVIRPVTECTVYILLKNENVYHFICEKVVSIYSPIWRRRAFFSRNKRKMYYLSGDWVIVWWHPVHEVGLRFALFPNGCNFCQTQKKNIYFPKIANTLYMLDPPSTPLQGRIMPFHTFFGSWRPD